MEFVDIEVEVWEVFASIKEVGTGHGGDEDARYEDQAEEVGVFFADITFGKVDQQNFLLVHYFAEIESTFLLSNNIAHHFVGDETAELGDDVVEDFGFVEVGGLGDLVGPIAADHWVRDVRK